MNMLGLITMLFLGLYFLHGDVVEVEAWKKKSPTDITDLLSIQERLRKLLPDAKRALVSIEAGDGAGSGVIVSKEGLVLTAAHVIGKTGKKMQVRLPNGKRASAITLGGSEISDAAMLQILGDEEWPFVPIANKGESQIGDWCFGLGHPGGFDKERGVVVRIGKIIAKKDETMQTDSRLLGGDSGGPLFDFEGQLIAIHSRVSQKPDQNFHVPVESFHANWDTFRDEELISYDLMEDGGFFGVACEETDNGLIVREVISGTAAEKAGLKLNDILLEVNDEPLDSREEFIIIISSLKPGDEAKILYQRKGAQLSVKANLGVRPSLAEE
jgi:serine protease Do